MNEPRQQCEDLPHDNEAERAVLGAVLIAPEAAANVLDNLTEKDFYRFAHRRIFTAMAELFNRGEVVDLVTVRSVLTSGNDLEHVGGPAYLTGLSEAVFSAANVSGYIAVVQEQAVRRMLLQAGERIMAEARAHPGPTQDLLALAEGMVQDVVDRKQRNGGGGLVPLAEVLPEVMDKIEAAYKAGGQNTGITSGLYDLDHLTTGWQPGDLIILAGRPGMGKTSLAMLFAVAAAKKDHQVGIFSLEMSTGQLVNRLLATESGVNLLDIRSGRLSGEDWRKLGDAGGRLWNRRIGIDDRGGLTVAQIRETCIKLKRASGLDLVIVDYLQLGSSAGENQNIRIAAISGGLKNMAKELNVPVILLSQLSRAVEGRDKRRPAMSDLRDSGAIEQDADIILLLYRAGAYVDMVTESNKHAAELYLAKQRNGPTGIVNLRWEPKTATFSNPSRT
jgi:replicative DNA helicase